MSKPVTGRCLCGDIHVHVEEQLPWFEIADALPRFARGSKDNEPVRHGPRALE